MIFMQYTKRYHMYNGVNRKRHKLKGQKRYRSVSEGWESLCIWWTLPNAQAMLLRRGGWLERAFLSVETERLDQRNKRKSLS